MPVAWGVLLLGWNGHTRGGRCMTHQAGDLKTLHLALELPDVVSGTKVQLYDGFNMTPHSDPHVVSSPPPSLSAPSSPRWTPTRRSQHQLADNSVVSVGFQCDLRCDRMRFPPPADVQCCHVCVSVQARRAQGGPARDGAASLGDLRGAIAGAGQDHQAEEPERRPLNRVRRSHARGRGA